MTTEALDEFRRVAGDVSRETYESIVEFEAIFRKWAARINLVAPSTLADLRRRHVLDSAQLLQLAPRATRWVDIGSGGGFPGAVIALLMKDRPGASVDLVESNTKKAAFLRTSLAELGAPARVHAKRVEDVHGSIVTPEVVTARALAPLDSLLALTEPWLATGSKGLFHKGRDYSSELEESSARWNLDLLRHASMVDAESVILEVSNLRRR